MLKKDDNAKKHHYMVAGEIIFTTPSEQGEVFHQINMNAVLTTDSKEIKAKDIGRAQQYLQLSFLRGTHIQPDIRNVIIFGFTYLGHFTEEEFQDGAQPKTEQS